jgi:hypothetical protein
MRGQCFLIEDYEGKVFTEVEARRRRKSPTRYIVIIFSIVASNLEAYGTSIEIHKLLTSSSYPPNVVRSNRSIWICLTGKFYEDTRS